MKRTVILLSICFTCAVAWFSDQQQQELKKFGAECTQDADITIGTLQDALVGEAGEVEQKVKCFVTCLLKKTQIMNEYGTINETVIRQKVPKDMPKDVIDEVINKCLKIDGKDDCDKATKFLKCVIKTTIAKEIS